RRLRGACCRSPLARGGRPGCACSRRLPRGRGGVQTGVGEVLPFEFIDDTICLVAWPAGMTLFDTASMTFDAVSLGDETVVFGYRCHVPVVIVRFVDKRIVAGYVECFQAPLGV
ncbi:hypothetical protein, partial [Polyangium sorediatum]